MGSAVLSFLQTVFRIRPEELRRTGAAFVYLFMAVGAFIISRITRTVLFLEIPGYAEKLPLMYLIQAVSVAGIMYAYSRVERRLRRDLTNIITLCIIIVATLAFRRVLDQGTATVYAIFYIWVEIFGTFLIVQFWSFTNEIFHSRQAKRLFALIGGGGVLANVAIGFGIRGSVAYIGTENLLYVICGCLAVCVWMVSYLGRIARADLVAAKERRPVRSRAAPDPAASKAAPQPKVFATRHVQLIALVVVLTYLASTLVDYQFQVIIGDSIAEKNDRSAYFGLFFGVTGIFAGFIQFFLTSRFLERFGVLFALILLPTAMLGGSATLLLVPALMPALWAVSLTKGAENTLRYSINDTTLQLLFLPVPAQIRGRAKTYIDGILKPMSIGVAGLVLGILMGSFRRLFGIDLGLDFEVTSISWIVGVGLLAWVGCLVALRKEYLRSLMQTLQRRRLNFEDATFQISDDSTVKTLATALESDRLGQVLHALELLPFVSTKARGPLDDKVSDLLKHEAHEVRVAAVLYWADSRATLHTGEVGAMLLDPSDSVRAAATQAYCALAREGAIHKVHPLLKDPDLEVRATAVAGLIRYGGLDGVLSCADVLKQMLVHEDPRYREKAAWILGEVGVQNFYQPLMPLFDDESESVRLAAIGAAGALQSPHLITSLVPKLYEPRLASAAVVALAAYGPDLLPVIAEVVGDAKKPPFMRAQACRVLARLGDPPSVTELCKHLLDDSATVRSGVVLALAHIANHSEHFKLEASAVTQALRSESHSFFRSLALEVDLGLDEDTVLLRDAIDHRKAQTLDRIFVLLGLIYPPQTIELVTRNLQSAQASTRANAVEVLDNLLEKEEKAYVIPIVDDAAPERKLAAASELGKLTRSDRVTRLRELLAGSDDWLRACSAMAAADWGLEDLVNEVAKLAASDDPICRQTSIVVLRRLRADDILRDRLPGLAKDPSTTVSRYAQKVLADVA